MRRSLFLSALMSVVCFSIGLWSCSSVPLPSQEPGQEIYSEPPDSSVEKEQVTTREDEPNREGEKASDSGPDATASETPRVPEEKTPELSTDGGEKPPAQLSSPCQGMTLFKKLKVESGSGFRWARRLAFTPDGKRLVTYSFGSDEHLLKIWSIPEGKLIKTLELPTGLDKMVMDPQGKRLYLLYEKGKNIVQFVDLSSGTISPLIRNPREDYRRVSSYGFVVSKDGKTIAWSFSYGINNKIENKTTLYHAQTGTREREISSLLSMQLAFHPSNKYLLGLQGSQLEVWEVPSGRKIRSFPARRVRDVTLSPDGKVFYTFDGGNKFSRKDFQSGLTIRSLTLPSGSFAPTLGRMAASPRGTTFAVGSGFKPGISVINTFSVWDVSTGQIVYSAEKTNIWDLAFQPNGNLLATANDGGYFGLWKCSNNP